MRLASRQVRGSPPTEAPPMSGARSPHARRHRRGTRQAAPGGAPRLQAQLPPQCELLPEFARSRLAVLPILGGTDRLARFMGQIHNDDLDAELNESGGVPTFTAKWCCCRLVAQ